MSKEQSKKASLKLKSKYSPTKMITPAQYLTELICERRAKKENLDLPDHFWEIDQWKKVYRYQVQLASQLLKNYSVETVLKCFHENKYCLSFKNPNLIQCCFQYKEKELKKTELQAPEVDNSLGCFNRKKTQLDILD